MLEKLIYKNHINETLEFGKAPLFVNENDLRNFAWEIVSQNDKISGFKKGIVSKTIPIILKCDTEAQGITLRNKIFEVFEKDVLAKEPGRIYIGDYYLRCYVTGLAKTDYLIHKGYMILSATVQTDFPAWIKESTTVFGASAGGDESFLDFPYDFPYDFKSTLVNSVVTNTGFTGANFRIVIYGQVTNPTLHIGGHEYSVNVEVGEGEYLTIDSVSKTIVLTQGGGEEVNCFNLRNKDSYIFQKIPAGDNAITSPNDHIYFDITILDERSEPKWT